MFYEFYSYVVVNYHGWHLNGTNGPLFKFVLMETTIIHIRDDASNQPSKQTSKKTDFTVDLLWWGSLRLAPTRRMHGIVGRA